MTSEKSTGIALMMMRLSLAAMVLVWTSQKLFKPEAAGGVFKRFYGLEFAGNTVIIIGVVQLIIVLAFAAGAFKLFTYGAMALMNLSSLVVSWPRLIDPNTTPNALFWASLPVLAATVALFMLRDRDKTLSLG